MNELIFATNNQHKINEVQSMLDVSWKLITLKEAGIATEIPEPFDTLEDNAGAKSQFIFNATGKDCFSEDTGLEVMALNNAPGVHSARYAGEHGNDKANIEKLLQQLMSIQHRTARFRTIISLILKGKEYRFEGTCPGIITSFPKGENGFGYDPVFIPEGADKTFAEMNMEEKNSYSHRKKAVSQLLQFLNQYNGQSKN